MTETTRWTVAAVVGAFALVAAVVALALVVTGDDDDGTVTASTGTTVVTTSTTVIATTTTTTTTTTSATTTAASTTTTVTAAERFGVAEPVVRAEPGLLCSDLAGAGFAYAEVVDYWEHEGWPARLDAAGNGRPCETEYDAAAVDGHWLGLDAARAVQRVVNRLGWCGYRLDLDQTMHEGPFADGSHRVRGAIDVDGDDETDLTVDAEVFPGEVLPVDADTETALRCAR